MLKLNLGCSDHRIPGYLGVDRCFGPGVDQVADLRFPWPWEESTIEEIVAHDVFEHIDNNDYRGQLGIVWAMNEAHRVLKPGGKLDLVVPSLPGYAPWVDPTHVNVWTADTRYYFDARWNYSGGERGRLGPAYGITALFKTVGGRSGVDWKPVQYAPDAPDRHKIMVILEAVK